MSKAQASLRVWLCVRLLLLRGYAGGGCSVVDLLVLQMHGIVVLLLLFQR